MLVFRLSFVNCCPSPLLSGSTLSPPSPLICVINYTVYTYKVCGGGGMGQGTGLQTNKHLPQSPFTDIFF
jgi:hypothetical protein